MHSNVDLNLLLQLGCLLNRMSCTGVHVHVGTCDSAELPQLVNVQVSHSIISPYGKRAIRESVDSLCRDDADMPMTPYIRKACNRPNAAFVSLFR